MIPKKIHYCWFGNGLMPKSQKDCIKSWKKTLPDYEIIRWDEDNFDINYCLYSHSAYKAKKYAFVSDVARCYFLEKHGGIYLDTDVEVFQKFDSFLNNNFFTAIELYNEFEEKGLPLLNEDFVPKDSNIMIPYLGFLSSVMGCEPQNQLVKDCLDFYVSINENSEHFNGITIDGLLPNKALKYGFKYKDETQILDENMLVLKTGDFGYAYSPNKEFKTLFHHNAASWQPMSKIQKRHYVLDQLNLLKTYNFMKSLRKKFLK